MGIVGLETAFAELYTHLVRRGAVTLERLIELLCTSPGRRFGIGTGIAVDGRRILRYSSWTRPIN